MRSVAAPVARPFACALRRLRFSRNAAPRRCSRLAFSGDFGPSCIAGKITTVRPHKEDLGRRSDLARLRRFPPCGKDRRVRGRFESCRFPRPARRCRSSVVEHSLGKGEVVSSILPGSTIPPSAPDCSSSKIGPDVPAMRHVVSADHARGKARADLARPNTKGDARWLSTSMGRCTMSRWGAPDRSWLSHKEHAGRNHRQAQPGNQHRPRRPEDQGALCRPRRAADRGLARRLWKDHCRRFGKVGKGDQVLRRQTELIGSATASSVVENPG
jgi:hypothetical protein